MKERLEELMKMHGLTSVKFAEVLSVQPSNISHILAGRNKPSFDFIVKVIERFPDVNSEWLLTGKGEIYKSKSISEPSRVTSVNRELFTSVTSSAHVNNPTEEEGFISNVEPEADEHIAPKLPIAPVGNELNKQVHKIILLYADGTFEVFQN